MPPEITETVGLLATSAAGAAGAYSASQHNFIQALASLREVLPPAEYEKFLKTSVPDSSCNGLTELSQGIRGRAKRKFDGLSSRLKNFSQFILQFSPVIDVLVSVNPSIAALVWGSVKFVITVSLNYVNCFDQISQAFQKLGDIYPSFVKFSQLFPESDKLRDSLADFCATSVRFCAEALKFLQGSSFRHIMNAIRKPFGAIFGDLEAELQRQERIVDRHIQLAAEVAAHRERQEASLFRSTATQHLVTLTDRNERGQNDSTQMIRLGDIENFSIQQYTDGKKRRHKVLLAAISTYDHKPSLVNARDKRHNGTGLWIFDVPEFKEWSQKQKSCGLWCYAIPGAGKTILTAGAIEYLFQQHQGPQVSISYFFCEFGTDESTRVRTILRSFIKQILSVFDKLSPEMENTFKAIFLTHQKEPTMKELCKALLCATQLAATTYLVIDGLDECNFHDRNELLVSMKELIQDSRSRVKIIVSSREKVDIFRSLKGFLHISLDYARNRSDIEVYVREVIDKKLSTEVLKVGEPSMAEEIKVALIQGSDGMFLWVEFQILEICKENNDNEIRKVLRSLPKGLDQTYSRILQRIVLNHKPKVAEKVFTWLAVGRRPLSLAELNEAVAFDPGCSRWDQGNFQNDPLNMLRNCGNLVSHDKDGTVRFAHYTVLEFLISESDRVAAEFSLRKPEANLYVGRICLMYLNFPDFQTQLSCFTEGSITAPKRLVGSMANQNSLVRSLLKFHPDRHVIKRAGPSSEMTNQAFQRALNSDSPPSKVLGQKFCLLDYVAENWIYHCSGLPQDDKEAWGFFTNLVYHQTMPLALEHLPWLHTDCDTIEFYNERVQWAVKVGHLALVKETFSRLGRKQIPVAAYINERNPEGQTLIHLASSRRNELVLKELIVAGAQVNARTVGLEQTALQIAAEAGCLWIVNRLIEEKADVNAKPGNRGGRTALQAAAGGGHLDVVNRLIEAKADVNAGLASYGGRTALQAAAGGGHLDVVNRLIEAKADVNAEPGISAGRTALQAAARGGHLDVVNRLIEAKADVNAKPGNRGGRTALQAAAGGGHLGVVNRLIEAKADVNAGLASYGGRTALQAAAGGGHLDVVNRLIEAKADVNAGQAYQDGRTALQAAAGGGHLDVVNRLRNAGAKG